jgi:hypothetical protein
MNIGLRSKIQTVAEDAIDLLQKAVSGKSTLEGGLMDRLIRLTGQGLKVEHMDQLKVQNDRSFGLRLLQFMPKDDQTRRKYIEMTNPELKPILLSAPEKKKQ